MPDKPFVVAVEGPSDSGKSTLAQALAAGHGGSIVILPCYVEVADERDLPPDWATTIEDQVDAVGVFLDLDRERAGSLLAVAGLVIADRCWLSLLAHVWAVEREGGPAAYRAACALVTAAPDIVRPDLILYLDVREENRRQRLDLADEGKWFTRPAFNRQLDAFFAREAPVLAPNVVRVDANGDGEAVLDRASTALRQRMGA